MDARVDMPGWRAALWDGIIAIANPKRLCTEGACAFMLQFTTCLVATLLREFAPHLPWVLTSLVNALAAGAITVTSFYVIGKRVPNTHGHPLVTLTFFIRPAGGFDRRLVLCYWIAQLGGTMAADGLLDGLFHLVTPHRKIVICPLVCAFTTAVCVYMESLLVMVLIFVRHKYADMDTRPDVRSWINGGTAFLLSFSGGHVSGACMHPFRFISLMIINRSFTGFIPYVIATTGACIVFSYAYLFLAPPPRRVRPPRRQQQ